MRIIGRIDDPVGPDCIERIFEASLLFFELERNPEIARIADIFARLALNPAAQRLAVDFPVLAVEAVHHEGNPGTAGLEEHHAQPRKGVEDPAEENARQLLEDWYGLRERMHHVK